jgi:hypothetical protein
MTVRWLYAQKFVTERSNSVFYATFVIPFPLMSKRSCRFVRRFHLAEIPTEKQNTRLRVFCFVGKLSSQFLIPQDLSRMEQFQLIDQLTDHVIKFIVFHPGGKIKDIVPPDLLQNALG